MEKINLNEFLEEMEKVLNEKIEKYQDTWQICKIGILKTKLEEQINKLNILKGDNNKRTLVHIANYCYFLYVRLNGIGD